MGGRSYPVNVPPCGHFGGATGISVATCGVMVADVLLVRPKPKSATSQEAKQEYSS